MTAAPFVAAIVGATLFEAAKAAWRRMKGKPRMPKRITFDTPDCGKFDLNLDDFVRLVDVNASGRCLIVYRTFGERTGQFHEGSTLVRMGYLQAHEALARAIGERAPIAAAPPAPAARPRFMKVDRETWIDPARVAKVREYRLDGQVGCEINLSGGLYALVARPAAEFLVELERALAERPA